MLQQTLGDAAELDVAVVRSDLAADVLLVALGLAADVLIALPAAALGHVAHPEVIGVGAQSVERLTESGLDLEAQSIEPDDVDRVHPEVGGHQNDSASKRMADEHKLDRLCDRSPEEGFAAVLDLNSAFSIDRTLRNAEDIARMEQPPERDLLPVLAWASASAPSETRDRAVADRIASRARDQMVTGFEQRPHDLAAGVEGVRDQDRGRSRCSREGLKEELHHPIKQGRSGSASLSLVANALVDARGEGNGSGMSLLRASQDRECLKRVSVDELGFGVVRRGLVQLLDRRHPSSFLADLEAISEADERSADAKHRQPLDAQCGPEFGEAIEAERRAMEEMKQTG